MLNELKRQVLAANLSLPAYGLVTFTGQRLGDRPPERAGGDQAFGHRLRGDDAGGSGGGGSGGQGARRAPQALVRHRHPLALYRAFADIGGVVHTHSRNATIWAQAGQPIPALGTTHADYFYGDIPCTRPMSEAEIAGDYEGETGKVIIETFNQAGRDPQQVPGVLVYSHGPFAQGKDAADAVHNAVVLEEVAIMAMATRQLAPAIAPMQPELLDKHFLRKHGKHAYYGQ